MYRLWGLVAFFIRKIRVSVKAPFFNFFLYIFNFRAGGCGHLIFVLPFLYRTTSFLSAGTAVPILSLFSLSALRFFFCSPKIPTVLFPPHFSDRNGIKAYLPKIKGASFGAFKLLEKLNFIFFNASKGLVQLRFLQRRTTAGINCRQGRVPFGAFYYFNVS